MAEPITLITAETFRQITIPFMSAFADFFRPEELVVMEWRGPNFERTSFLWGMFEHTKGEFRRIEIRGKRAFCVAAIKYLEPTLRQQFNNPNLPAGGMMLLDGADEVTHPIRQLENSKVKVRNLN